jgi:hypothetical protein
MNAIKKARKFIADEPANPNAKVLSRLVLSLESEQPFAVNELYGMDFDSFELALEVLKDWRLDRYYIGKAKLIDLSMQVSELKA